MISPDEHVSVYDVAGPAQAFPIVFVHGAAWTRNMWVPQIEALADEFKDIIEPQLKAGFFWKAMPPDLS